VRLAALAWMTIAVGCVVAPAEPAPPPAPAVVAAPPPPAEPAARAEAPAVSMGPSEPGFQFCCGDGAFKIEIACRDMIKRCYEKDAGGDWDATYGRHCKRRLGEGCYLSSCDARCR
jgi:hypothetical protein